jgi:ABC-type multidrug transport system ATPase subunit
MYICIEGYDHLVREQMDELVKTLKDNGHKVFFSSQVERVLTEDGADLLIRLRHGGGMLSSPDESIREQMRAACRESNQAICAEWERKQEERAKKEAQKKAEYDAWRAELERRREEAKAEEIRINGLRLFE